MAVESQAGYTWEEVKYATSEARREERERYRPLVEAVRAAEGEVDAVAEERRRWRPLVEAMQDTERAIDSTLRHLDIWEEMAHVHAADKVRRILEEIRMMEAYIQDFRGF